MIVFSSPVASPRDPALTVCLYSSWPQPATTTTFVFTKKRMMTGSAGPPYRDTRPQCGVCVLMRLVRGWPRAAMTALWRSGESIQLKVDRVSQQWLGLISFIINQCCNKNIDNNMYFFSAFLFKICHGSVFALCLGTMDERCMMFPGKTIFVMYSAILVKCFSQSLKVQLVIVWSHLIEKKTIVLINIHLLVCNYILCILMNLDLIH